jgi:integrase
VLLGAGSVLTAEQARKRAREVLAQATLGHDPQGEKAERRAKDKLTLLGVISEYLAGKEQQLRPKSLRETTRYLTDAGYFGPLHRLPIDSVTRKDVAALLVQIARTRGATTSSLARSALSAFYTWCMQAGMAETNPVIGVLRVNSHPRDRVLSDAELAKIWKATAHSGAFGTIVRLLILTGARRAEIGGLAWSEVDLTTGVWTLPKERSKNHRAHALPVPAAAMDLILKVPARVERDRLFGWRHAGGFSDWAGSKRRLDARVNLPDWRVHDIRRSVATGMADIGIAPHVIEEVLNHRSGHRAGVAGIYNRSSYEREVRAALAMWADHINSLIEGDARKVVAFRTENKSQYT